MTQRQINLTLKYATIALLAGACAIAAFGLLLPLKSLSTAQNSSPAIGGGSHAAAPATAPDLASFEPLFNRPLRIALGLATPSDNQAAPDATQQPIASPPSLAFVGTVGDSLAMIRVADGSVAVVAVGEQVGGAELLAIRATQVDLRSTDGTFTLTKPADSSTDAAVPEASSPPSSNSQPANFAHGY